MENTKGRDDKNYRISITHHYYHPSFEDLEEMPKSLFPLELVYLPFQLRENTISNISIQ